MLAEYERIYPGAAKKLFENFFAQTKHRQAIEMKKVDAENIDALAARREKRRGQWLALASLVFVLIATVLFAWFAQAPVVAAGFGVTCIGIVVSAFALNQRYREPVNERQSPPEQTDAD